MLLALRMHMEDVGMPAPGPDEELVLSLLSNMSAPESERRFQPSPAWPLSRFIIGATLGLLMGAAGYFFLPQDRQDRVELSPEPPGIITKNQAIFPAGEVESPSPLQKRLSKLAKTERKPRFNKSMYRRGWRLYRRQKYSEAMSVFEKVVATSPQHTGGYYGLSLCLFEQEKEDLALQVLERGARKVGPKSMLWVLAGSIYQWMGKERMARMAYRRYLRDHPRGPTAKDLRAILARRPLPRMNIFDVEMKALVANEK
jgi:hypothetical protein